MTRAQRIASNLQQVQQQIAEAAQRSGRQASDVTLVAVSKYADAEATRLLVQAGCHTLAESRPQELWQKAEALSDLPVRWHQIGHLQRNKLRRTLPLIELLQSVDSLRLLQAVDQTAAALSRTMPILLEVNISGDEAKHGFAPDELPGVMATIAQCRHITLRGLMGMASFYGGRDQARRDFARLSQLRDRLQADCPPDHSLAELSMGMSGDFDLAIEQGATMVRIGSALFEGLDS